MRCVLFSILSIGWVAAAIGQTPEFKPRTVINRPFPAIVDAPVVGARDIELADHELVLGVAIDGKARAYPINMLTGPRREIINDTLNQLPIAATW